MHTGKVEVFFGDLERHQKRLGETHVICTLSSGQFFGEEEFFTGQSRRFSIRCKDFSTLLKVSRPDFLRLLREYPQDYEIFCKIKDELALHRQFRSLGS